MLSAESAATAEKGKIINAHRTNENSFMSVIFNSYLPFYILSLNYMKQFFDKLLIAKSITLGYNFSLVILFKGEKL